MRKLFEFYCSGSCQKYFDFKLNTALNGNYRIHCPNCGHIHYRVVTNGQITEGRFSENDTNVLIEDIRPMKSSCRDVQKETHLDSEINPDPAGFLHRLWQDLVQS
jgi:hypothetical protein